MLIAPPTHTYCVVRNLVKRLSFVRRLYAKYHTLLDKDLLSLRASVENHGYGTYRKMIIGSNNKIIIGNDTRMSDTQFHIVGNKNTIRIGNNCIIGKRCSFWMEGDNINITIGDGCTFTQYVHFNAQERESRITIGTDCMFSNHIIVRTSDSHPIYSLDTNERINLSGDVVIGSHVWIAPDTKIMKGVCIGDNSIIGSNTIVTRNIPSNCLAVGLPAKVVKNNVNWTREDVIFK